MERRAGQDPRLTTVTLTHYDGYGQPRRVTQLADPLNGRATDRTNPVTTTTYDPTYQTFPVRESVWLAHRGGTVVPTGTPVPPAAPSVTALSGTFGNLRVSWSAPPDGEAITHYELRYRVGSSGDWTAVSAFIGPATEFDLWGLVVNTAYEVQVRAWNSSGASAWSPSGTATTAGLPTGLDVGLDVGSGADGAAVFDGTTDVVGFTRQGTTYTATRSEPAVYHFTTITVEPNVMVTWPQGVSVWFKHTGRFWVKAGGTLDGNGKGFAGGAGYPGGGSHGRQGGSSGQGPGAGAGGYHGGGGAGHGGHGVGGGSNSGQAYGSADLAGAWTIQKAGSGGGGGGADPGHHSWGDPPHGLPPGGRGGAGGGAFRSSGQTARIDGLIRSDGASGRNAGRGSEPASGGGGGSGGAVLVEAVTLSGAGTLSANGGEGGKSNGRRDTSEIPYDHDRGASNAGKVGGGGRIRRNAPTHSNTITTSVLGPGGAADGTSTVGYLARPSTVSSPPLAPTVTALSGTVRSLRVRWTAPATGGAAITHYELRARAGSSGDWTDFSTVLGPATAHDLRDLAAGTAYAVQVRAHNGSGASAWSPSGTATTAAAPGLYVIDHADNQVWQIDPRQPGSTTAPYGLVGTLPTGCDDPFGATWHRGQLYVVERNGDLWRVHPTQPSTTSAGYGLVGNIGLSNARSLVSHQGTLYVTTSSNRLHAIDLNTVRNTALGNTDLGHVRFAYLWAAFSAADGLYIFNRNTRSLFLVDPADPDSTTAPYGEQGQVPAGLQAEAGATHYGAVYVADSSGTPSLWRINPRAPASTTAPYGEIGALPAGLTKPFAAAGVTLAGTPATPVTPLAPTVVALATDRLRVFWTAPPAGSAAITGYELQYRVGSSGDWTTISTGVADTYYDLAGRPADTSYEVQVRAQNSVGWSAWSNRGSGRTLPAPETTLTTTRTFDAGTGQVTSSTDPNGAVTTASYDTFGRLTQVRRPGDTTDAPALTYTYHYGSAPNRLLLVEKDGSDDGGRHTVQFYDGLGRLIETKTELADNVNDQGRHQVVRRMYTTRDLVLREYVPWGTPAQTSSDFLTKFEAVEQRAAQPFAAPGYDEAGRVTQVVAPDGAVTTTAYGDGQRTLTDANGHQRVEYTDGYGRLAAVYESGPESTALQFDGRDDYVTVPSIALAHRSFSVAGWVYRDPDVSGDRVWFAARTSNHTRQHLHLGVRHDGGVMLKFWGDDLHSPGGAVTLGAWHHLVATYDQPTDTSRLYVNGAEVASGRQGPFEGVAPTIMLGARGSPAHPSQHWHGQLYEVRVYGTALSADAVRAQYATGRGQYGTTEPDLVAGWHFDEGQGSAVGDYSGHGRTGTLGNDPTWVPADVARRGTHYTYDLQGNLTGVTDAAGNRTTITYDGLGRKTRVQDPDTGTWSYGYDALGHLLRQTDAVGNQLTFTYDLLGRLTRQQGIPPGGTASTLATHTYDTGGGAAHALGRRTGLTDSSGSTTWAYDQRGRVTGQTQTILGTAYTTGWSYDTLDRPVTLTYPDGEVLTTTYGAHGRPLSAVGTHSYVTGATYSDQRQPLGWTYGNGTTAQFDYYDQPYEHAPDGSTPPAAPTPGPGNALQFDGQNAHLTVPSMALDNRSFSVAGWVYRDPAATGERVWFAARERDSTRRHLHLGVQSDGRVALKYWNDDLQTPPYTVTAGAWHHVVVTYDQPTDTSRIYVNGAQVASGNQGPFEGQNPTIRVGRAVSSPYRHWHGQLDEVRVYTTALSAAAVTAQYAGGNGQHGTPAPDLVAGWHFDEGSGGAVTDYSGQGHTAQLANGPTWVSGAVALAQVPPAGGTALQFDGREDYVTVPSLSLDRRSFSVAGWVYRDQNVSGDRVWFAARAGDSTRQHLRLGVRRDGVAFVDFGREWRGSPRDAVTAGAWHHVVVTYDLPSDTSRLYVDGVEVASGNQGPFEGRNPAIVLGARGSPPHLSQHWQGQLDEVGVYRTALSATAVQALYRGGGGLYGRPEPDLVAGWHFDAGSGTTVRDYRGSGLTGTLVNGPAWVPAAVASGAARRDYRLRQLTYRDPLQALLQQHGYRYDRVGNITSWWQQDRTTGPWRWAATYDARDRLTGAAVRTSPTGVPAAFAYTYDAIGNITSGPLGAYTYGDPAHVHAATAAGGTHTYSYDANGAVLTRSEGATTYTHGYDVQGRQTSVAIAGGATSTFLYNGDGELVARQVAGRTVAHYAAGGLYEVDPVTNTTRKYATFGGRRVAVTTTTGAPPQTTTTVQYLHQDHLGSTGLVTTADGAFVQARFHAPFGAPWYTPTTAGVAPALGTRFGEPWPAVGTQQAAPNATDRHYTGQRSFEASLGSLYHYQARWYSPVLGRFLSPDPIVPEPGNPQALNRYSYVVNNPLRYTDPSGHCFGPVSVWLCLGAATLIVNYGPVIQAAAPYLPIVAEDVIDDLWNLAGPNQSASTRLIGGLGLALTAADVIAPGGGRAARLALFAGASDDILQGVSALVNKVHSQMPEQFRRGFEAQLRRAEEYFQDGKLKAVEFTEGANRYDLVLKTEEVVEIKFWRKSYANDHIGDLVNQLNKYQDAKRKVLLEFVKTKTNTIDDDFLDRLHDELLKKGINIAREDIRLVD